jgi:nanoRNase/pAp phosphatase (c-di-AMP/oligoRNAs hydrolase)
VAKALQLKKLLEIIRGLKGKKIAITFHYAGDFDALSSSFVLKKLLLESNNQVWVIPPSVSGTEEKLFIERGFFFDKHDFDVDVIFIMDTNSKQLLDPIFSDIKKSKAKKIVIDHHVKKRVGFADYYYADENAAATSEIVYTILENLGLKPDRETALLLSSGIVTDSANFVAATPETFRILHELLIQTEVTFQEVLEYLTVPVDISKKIAKLKAASRLSLTRVGDYLIVSTEVNAHEGSVANSLLGLGADVAIVGSKGDGIRFSGRARNALVDKGFNLVRDIMLKVGELIGGEGGGHPAAAGANGSKIDQFDKAMKESVRLASEKLKRLQE